MKIGLVLYGDLGTPTGGNVYDRMLVSHLHAQGDEVAIFSLPVRGYARRLIDNFTFKPASDLDLLLEDELTHPSVFALNAYERGYPIVSIVHNLHSSERRTVWKNWLFRQLEKRHVASVDGYIFNSETTRISVQRIAGTGKPWVVAAPGGDRLGAWPHDAIRRRAFEPGPLRLLFLANVTALKGLEVLLTALGRLPQGAFTLDVVGSCDVEPAYAARMQRIAQALAGEVVFHGSLDGDPLVGTLKRAQVLVIPSNYEGFGIAYLEGMAYGLACIGTTAGAIPALISPGVNGFTVEPGDHKAIAEVLTRLAADRELLATLADGASKTFQARPGWRVAAEQIRRFLLRMLQVEELQAPQQAGRPKRG